MGLLDALHRLAIIILGWGLSAGRALCTGDIAAIGVWPPLPREVVGGRKPLRHPSMDGRSRLDLETIKPRPFDAS
jgi:hypothetical protein